MLLKPVIRYHFAENNKSLSGLTKIEANTGIPFPCNLSVRYPKDAPRISLFRFNVMELQVPLTASDSKDLQRDG